MKYVIKVATFINVEGEHHILDSDFCIIEDGRYPTKGTDQEQYIKFLNTIETLKEGFSNGKYSIKLAPVKPLKEDLFIYLPEGDEQKPKGYSSKAKTLMATLEKFSKKLGIEVGDPAELSEF